MMRPHDIRSVDTWATCDHDSDFIHQPHFVCPSYCEDEADRILTPLLDEACGVNDVLYFHREETTGIGLSRCGQENREFRYTTRQSLEGRESAVRTVVIRRRVYHLHLDFSVECPSIGREYRFFTRSIACTTKINCLSGDPHVLSRHVRFLQVP